MMKSNDKNSGGIHMSLNKSAMGRHYLLASVSVLAASVAATAPARAADTVVTVAEGQVLAAAATATPVITASPAAGDTFTVNNNGFIRSTLLPPTGRLSVGGSGAGTVIINNNGQIRGRMLFTNATGPITLNNNAGTETGVQATTTGWYVSGVTTFGSGGDTINNGVAGLIRYSPSGTLDMAGGDDLIRNEGRFVLDATLLMGLGDDVVHTTAEGIISADLDGTIDFGGGVDHYLNEGRLSIGTTGPAATLTLTGLETFENSGLIILGPGTTEPGSYRGSDGQVGAGLIAQGVAFTGSGDSRIALDANLSSLTQADCATASVADCLDFTGGSTAGSTVLTVTDVGVGGGALNPGITLIVGSSAADHFSLDPNVPGYVQTDNGEAIQSGLVGYRLVYDDVGNRHMLVGALADEAFQGATFATVAQETWRATTGGWFDRQADLRATPGGLEPSKGLWARGGLSVSERQLQASYDQAGTTYDYNVDHKQKTAHFTVGADILGAASQDSAWVVGILGGMSRTDVEYDATPTEAVATGATGGLYASWIAGPLFVDGSVTGNVLDLKVDAPNMQLGESVQLTQTMKSVGARVDAGWRINGGAQGIFAEPLVSMAMVRTKIEDLEVPGGGGTFDYEDSYNSSRFGAGLRVGIDTGFMGGVAAYSLTGRYWNESEGSNASAVVLTNGGTTTPMVDELTGGFTEVLASLNLYSADGGVSGFFNVGGKVGDDYSSKDVAVGIRLRW